MSLNSIALAKGSGNGSLIGIAPSSWRTPNRVALGSVHEARTGKEKLLTGLEVPIV